MLKVTILLISMGAVGATLFGSRAMRSPLDDSNRKVSDLKVSAGSAGRLEIRIPLGHVTLVADGSTDLTVHAVRSAKRPLDAEARRWLNDSYLKAENRNGVLTLRDHPFGADSLNDIHSKGADHDGKDLSLEVQIHVPADLAAKLDVTAGDADVRGRFRSLDAGVAAGELSSDSVRCKEQLSLRVGAGELKMTIPSGANADVSASVGVGQITGLPEGAKNSDGIHLGDKRHGRTGRGDAKVNVHVGAGEIKINSQDRILATTNLEVGDSDSDVDVPEMDVDKDLDLQKNLNIDKTVNDAVTQAMAEVSKAMASIHPDLRIDIPDIKIDDIKFEDMHDLMGMDSDVEKSMQSSRAEIERAMKKIKPEIEKAMRNLKPEIEKAMKRVKPEIEKAMRSLKTMKPEIDERIRRAMQELERAMREFDRRSEGN